MVDAATRLKGDPQIELSRVNRWFGPTHAVADVSFRVMAGEVFGYIGPNGAGKTTSMRILATLDEPTSGDAWVDGFSVVEDPDRVRSRLGFMPDYYGAYQNVNVGEYLDFFARAYGLRGSERRHAISFAMDFTGLEPLRLKPIDGLSKGMKQRLCLGRTMIHDPSVMVLDEPAAGLDPRARIELREMISRLADLGKAVLISSHILTELAEVCDRVGIIEQGQLLAVGSVEEISERVAEHQTVRATLVGDPGRAAAWLAEQQGVTVPDQRPASLPQKAVEFDLVGDDTDRARLLRAMIEAGMEVSDFSCRTRSLEDVFLEVTRGRVQ
ncbi:putative ABC transporter ATP-binding protein YbhF [Pseudobythopirellula maris]|uniref:Putative ABC transporter ATP-binding protein YbhF n=1 Tax=Pseudobythopirellula maris TaxID=2527991 RepID=A0A5C5ZSG8_9BACT|nr:ABC transporter ATP-binding protein [Pseudobythopirellula maris]TWT89927.1 putative ABC transporter ATP-binding protein YbhF [Pseudobythopirellula maris]